MDYLKPYDFKQLKAFFLALQQSRFNLRQISNMVIMDGVATPVDKAHCLELLRSFPNLSGEEFKDDNFLIKYLSQPGNIKQILGRLTTTQQIELTKVLEEKPAAAGVTGEQPGTTETSAEQDAQVPVDTTGGATGMPGLPSSPSFSSARTRVIYNIPHTPDDKSGRIVKGPGAEAPTKQIFITDKGSVVTGMRNIKSPGWLKNFGSNTQIFARKNLGRIGRGLGEIAKGVGRGIAGPMLNGAYKGLGKVGSGGLDAIGRLSSPGLRGASKSFASSGSKKLIWGLVGAFLILVIGTGLIGGLSGTTPPIGAAPIAPGNLNSCLFTRGDRNPTAENYQSKLLMSYFTEAEAITSVPAVVLAAIARVETPSSVTWTDNTLKDFCPESGDGALGIMQIISHFSHRTDAICQECIALGASYLNKTVDQLTKDDYCDPRTSIFLGAGFILKKLSYLGYGDATKWDPSWTNNKEVINKMVGSFYGCLKYGGPTDRCEDPGHKYDYSEDVWTSIQSCKTPSPFTSVIAPPANPDAQLLALDILNKFGIAMDSSFNYDYLKWTWEKLHNVSTTNFLNLIKGGSNAITVIRDDTLINAQISCSAVRLRGVSRSTGQSYPEPLFKVVLIHELAHLIEACNPDSISQKSALSQVVAQEGYLTNYSKNSPACVGSNNLNEDYAETVTYFLNPELGEQSLGIGVLCEPQDSNNPYSRNKPLHQEFVTNLLGGIR